MCNFQAVKDLFQTLDPSVWRKRARVVAYLEILLYVIEILTEIGYLVVGAAGAHQRKTIETTSPINVTGEATKPSEENHAVFVDESIVKFLSMILLAGVAMACVEVWATVMLIKATKVGADPKFALERARIWRYITIVLTILSAILTGFAESLIIDAVETLLQVFFIWVVSMFIGELRKTIHAAKQAGDDFVQVA